MKNYRMLECSALKTTAVKNIRVFCCVLLLMPIWRPRCRLLNYILSNDREQRTIITHNYFKLVINEQHILMFKHTQRFCFLRFQLTKYWVLYLSLHQHGNWRVWRKSLVNFLSEHSYPNHTNVYFVLLIKRTCTELKELQKIVNKILQK